MWIMQYLQSGVCNVCTMHVAEAEAEVERVVCDSIYAAVDARLFLFAARPLPLLRRPIPV